MVRPWCELAQAVAALRDRAPSSKPSQDQEAEERAQRLAVGQALATRACAHLGGGCPQAGCCRAGGPQRGRRCGGCGVVRYCSEACCRADWLRHRTECGLLREAEAAAAAVATGQGL